MLYFNYFKYMKHFTFQNIVLGTILIFSLTGLWAAFTLSIEKVHYLETLTTSSTCSISSAINCATVMNNPQASVLGFPNSFMGIAGYMATLVIAFVGILAKVENKWLWRFSLLGSFGAFVFSYWLVTQSIFSIRTLCPYCLLSAISSTNIFFGFLVLGMKENILGVSGKFQDLVEKVINKFLYFPAFALWYALWILIISAEFGDRLVK